MKRNMYTSLLTIVLFVFVPSILSAQFTEVSIESGILFQHESVHLMGGGGLFFDYDNDGWQDIYVAGGGGKDGLFHNNGDGTFTNVSEAAGLGAIDDFQTTGAISADIDNDGFRDVFITTWHSQRSLLMHNNGDGTFTEMAEQIGLGDTSYSMAASFGDYNVDGYVDLYVGNYVKENGSYTIDEGYQHECYPNFFYVNNGDGTFEEASDYYRINNTGGCALTVAFTDYDNDADVDIYLGNDFGEWIEPNALFVNMYPTDFFSDFSTLTTLDIGIYAMGIAIGDYNEDGRFDYYVSNLGRNRLIRNDGNFQFTELSLQAGVDNSYAGTNPETGNTLLATSWGTAFFDYDNDTYLDLFVCNGHIPAIEDLENAIEDPNKLYQNNQADGTFTDVSEAMGVANTDICRGISLADYDNDGDMDMLVMGIMDITREYTLENHIMLYRNDSPQANWLKVELEGVTNNKQGMGSRIEVTVEGRTFIREIGGGSGFLSQNSTVAHFGLGAYEMIDELKVRWLGGEEQIFTNVAANQLVSIKEGEGTAIEEQTAHLLQLHSTPNPFQTTTQIHYFLPKASIVSLAIYDVTGRLIEEIGENAQTAGNHTIDWKPAAKLTSGVYFCRMTTDFGIASHRLVIGR